MWGFPRASAGRGRQAHHESSIQVLSLCLCVCACLCLFLPAHACLLEGGLCAQGRESESKRARAGQKRKAPTSTHHQKALLLFFAFCVVYFIYYVVCPLLSSTPVCIFLNRVGGTRKRSCPFVPRSLPRTLFTPPPYMLLCRPYIHTLCPLIPHLSVHHRHINQHRPSSLDITPWPRPPPLPQNRAGSG